MHDPLNFLREGRSVQSRIVEAFHRHIKICKWDCQEQTLSMVPGPWQARDECEVEVLAIGGNTFS